jgi:hypothetical protein
MWSSMSNFIVLDLDRFRYLSRLGMGYGHMSGVENFKRLAFGQAVFVTNGVFNFGSQP